jgi:probable rRNA maturation factor
VILNRQKKYKIDTRRAGRNLKRLLKHLQCEDREVTVVYLDDEGLRNFNRTYRKKNRPTNVLSFSLQEGDFGDLNPQLLGDILISVERAVSEASRARLPLDDMMDYLTIHGLLHLMGYDHETSRRAARAMKKKEEDLFSILHGYSIRSMLDP